MRIWPFSRGIPKKTYVPPIKISLLFNFVTMPFTAALCTGSKINMKSLCLQVVSAALYCIVRRIVLL